jgi:hypothetical protein
VQTTDPSFGGRILHLDHPDFTGEMRVVFTADEYCDVPLSEMAALNQLAASPSGSHIAVVKRVSATSEEVAHTGIEGLRFVLRCDEEDFVTTRIINVGEDNVLVWGAAEGMPSGVWLLTPRCCRYLYPMQRLSGFIGYRNKFAVGESVLYPDSTVIGMPWGLWPLCPGSRVRVNSGSAFVLEPLGGQTCAYQVSSIGTEHFSTVCSQNTLAAIPWGKGMAIVQSSLERSAILQMGLPIKSCPAVITIDGSVIEAWGSPCKIHNKCALLVGVEDEDGDKLVLMLDDLVVHEGRFSMRSDDLFWSPRGISCAAFVYEDGYGKIVSPRNEIAVSDVWKCDGVLVSEGGYVRAAILRDGREIAIL